MVRVRTSEPGRFHDDSQNSRSRIGLAPTAVHIRTSEPSRRFEPFHRLDSCERRLMRSYHAPYLVQVSWLSHNKVAQS